MDRKDQWLSLDTLFPLLLCYDHFHLHLANVISTTSLLTVDTAQEQKLEGEFRFAHSRVITHAEEIAFYGGNQREKQIANESFSKIYNHVQKVYSMHFLNGIFDSIFVKYLATVGSFSLILF